MWVLKKEKINREISIENKHMKELLYDLTSLGIHPISYILNKIESC